MWDAATRPSVLRLDGELRTLNIRPNVSGPPELGQPARQRVLHTFNPSITTAPRGLCLRCAYIVSLRADALHQCDSSSPLWTRETGTPSVVATNAWFKSTVIAALDRNQHVLGWTWLIIASEKQVSASSVTAHSRWFVVPGASDAFQPPWGAMSCNTHRIQTRDLDSPLGWARLSCCRCCHCRRRTHFL